MKKNILLIILIQISQLVFAQTFPDVIIKDVNIIPVTKDTILVKKSIAILNGKISDINDFEKLKKNSKTKILNGTNKFLLPGLTEMHIHLPNPQKLDTFLTTMVAAGVTHVRVMYSDEPILEQRKSIESKIIKPRVYYPYLLTKNTVASSEKQVDSLFNKIKEGKYDFVKLYSMQHRKDFNDIVFDRIMTSANKSKVIVCGHYPNKIKLTKVLSSGFKSIEHLAGYSNLNGDELEQAIKLTKQYNVYNCPTLDWDVMGYDLSFPDDYNKRLVMFNAPQHYINKWNKDLEGIVKQNGSEKILKDKQEYMPTFEKKMRILKRLNETNNLLILGGESENLFQLEGFNMHEEMVIWSNAGIANFDILKASIFNPAIFFNEDKTRGTVEVGKEANLIMLDENPLLDIKNIKTINSTIINGNIFYKSDLLKKI
jgi:hypothetical protein